MKLAEIIRKSFALVMVVVGEFVEIKFNVWSVVAVAIVFFFSLINYKSQVPISV